MKKFGDTFKKYEPFEIDYISIPDTSIDYHEIVDLGVKVDRYGLAELISVGVDSLSEPGGRRANATKGVLGDLFRRRVLRRSDFSEDIETELNKVKVGVAPVANVYQISPDQPDLSNSIKNTLPYFNYYLVELGLNVSVGREARIPKLKFEAELHSDGENRTDVTTHSVSPSDRIKKVKIIDGKISIGVNNLLKLIPGPIGQIIPNLLNIEINPIKFRWNYTKYEIDVSGPLDYNVSWFVYKTEVVQSFNPMIILKSRREIKEITAKVRVLYQLTTGRWRKPETHSDTKTISILPLS